MLLLVAIFVLVNRSTSQTVRSSTVNSATTTASSISQPLDHLSSAQIAYSAAQLTGVAELTSVRNQADSERALLTIVPNDTTILAKPQVVSTAQKSKVDILHYVVLPGDTVDSVANKYHITTGSITGSNSLSGTALKPGTTILIPPGNGIVYKVKAGDTVATVVSKYGADRNLLVSVNDAENGLSPGDEIWIPNVIQPNLAVSYASSRGFAVGSFTPIFGYNGYDYGYCTWYVASKIAVPSNWGNANTWDNYAARTPGWTVSLSPRAGAIGQTDAGFQGHVAIVTAVSDDGSMIQYSDMNGLAGWGRVGQSGWVAASHFQHYIFRL